MSKINWGRFLLAVLISSIIFFVTDGLMHNKILEEQWKVVFAGMTAPPPHNPASFAYFGLFEIGRGFISILVYVLLRPMTGPGPRTAVIAALAGWFAFSVAGPAQFIPLALFTNSLWIIGGAVQLVASLIGTLAGAASYKQ